MMSIQREVFNKTSIVEFIVPEVKIWDLDLSMLDMDGLPDIVQRLRTSPKVVFGWTKGNKLTMWIVPDNDGSIPQWGELLDIMGIGVKVGPKTAKRIARAFSPRDVVVRMPESDINIELVRDDEFAADTTDMTDEDKEALMDGMIAIRKGFMRKLLKDNGYSFPRLAKAEGLSMSMIYSGGFMKAFAYIVDDEDMPIEGADIITSSANIKSELWTTDGMVWLNFDIFYPYRDPKSHAQVDVMLGRMLHNREADMSYLADTLAKYTETIINGDAVKTVTEWEMPSLETKIHSGKKVNEQFAALGDMTQDMAARGLDYRWFPGLVDMLTTAGSAQWWNRSKEWPMYPLPCAWARPIISESGAVLIGEYLGEEIMPGTIRAIRGGHVWVVSDPDYIEFFRLNSGGGDLDDHFNLIFRTIDGVKSVMTARNPMGWREFNVFKFVEGDPFPTYTDRTGNVIEFPVIPGKVMRTLHQSIKIGETRITGMGEFDEVVYPSEYGPDAIIPILSDLVGGESGNVGSIINAIMLAAGTNPALLNTIPASMETIIDAFVQGGGAEVRSAMSTWGETLVALVGTNPEVDAKLWKSRAGRAVISESSKYVRGFFSQRAQDNVNLRKGFENRLRKFAQDEARKPNELIHKMEEMFGVKRQHVGATNHVVIAQARELERGFRYAIMEANRARNEARDEFNGQMPDINWTAIYQAHHDRLVQVAKGDMEYAQLLVLANWFVCMAMPTSRGKITDRSIMNSRVWPLFIQALVNFGMAMDLDKLVGDGNPWTTSWEATCVKCSHSRVLMSRTNYARYITQHKVCSNCK